MRSRASLFLMEQLVMILVFSLAAALCLRLFARTQEISLETARQDAAVAMAQNGAELLKVGIRGEEIEKKLEHDAYTVEIQEFPIEMPGFARAEIAVYYESRELFSLTVGYQEVSE